MRGRATAPRMEAPEGPDRGSRFDDPLPLGMRSRLMVNEFPAEIGLPPSLVPPILEEPGRRGRFVSGALVGAGIAVAAAVIALIIVVEMLPAGNTRAAREPAVEPNSFSSRYSDPPSRGTSRLDAGPPQLVVAAATVGQSGDAFPLGLTLSGAGSRAVVIITGLADGATLSSGQSAGPGSWRLTASDLDGTVIQPPQGFSGTMEVLAELRLADGSVAERRPLRFERAAPAARPARRIDPGELAALNKRGEDYIAARDLASARLVLQRAAESGDARAALTLAGTYDPNVIERLGIKGVAADIRLALVWYGKARDFGSPEAPRRLELLASRDR
jgi:hypothetical protein